MTVKELKEQLSKFNDNDVIVIEDHKGHGYTTDVKLEYDKEAPYFGNDWDANKKYCKTDKNDEPLPLEHGFVTITF